MISVATLIACGIGPTQARLFAAPLAVACRTFDINTVPRMAAFIAQAAHESAMFTRLEESLWYTTPERIRQMWPNRVPSLGEAAKLCRVPQALANRVYAGRLGNGDEASGDGWRYRGRGLFQLTGRSNYARAAIALFQPYEVHPERVADPVDAARTAAWYFAKAGCRELADASLIDQITRAINGPGMVAADERRERFEVALTALA